MGRIIVANVMPITGTAARVAARLCNFETDKSYLLSDHQEFHDTEVAPVIRSMKKSHVDLFGDASRIGPAAHNRARSGRRIEAVKWRIEQYAIVVTFRQLVGFGEERSGDNETDNAGYYRAVEVYVYAEKPPTPAPPKPRKSLSCGPGRC